MFNCMKIIIDTIIALFFVLISFVPSCSLFRERPVDKDKLKGGDYRLFQNTPAWELAKAIQDNDKKKIHEIVANNPSLINYQEPQYGGTLLHLSILNQQFNKCKILIDNGADVNIIDYSGKTALMKSCSYPNKFKITRLLVENGANVNVIDTLDVPWSPRTALVYAARVGNVECVKFLVENGADINCLTHASSALGESICQENYDVALYLIQQGADISIPMLYDIDNEPIYILELLRTSSLDINSKDHKNKMLLVKVLKEKGLDYTKEPIPDFILKRIKERYPKRWEEVIEKY